MLLALLQMSPFHCMRMMMMMIMLVLHLLF
jgi:hypothetical protein